MARGHVRLRGGTKAAAPMAPDHGSTIAALGADAVQHGVQFLTQRDHFAKGELGARADAEHVQHFREPGSLGAPYGIVLHVSRRGRHGGSQRGRLKYLSRAGNAAHHARYGRARAKSAWYE